MPCYALTLNYSDLNYSVLSVYIVIKIACLESITTTVYSLQNIVILWNKWVNRSNSQLRMSCILFTIYTSKICITIQCSFGRGIVLTFYVRIECSFEKLYNQNCAKDFDKWDIKRFVMIQRVTEDLSNSVDIESNYIRRCYVQMLYFFFAVHQVGY